MQQKSAGRILLALLCGATLFLSACSDTPTEINSVGGSLTEQNILTRDTTFLLTSSASFKQVVPMDSSYGYYGTSDNSTDLVGRNKGYTAYTVLRFSATSIPDRDTINVVSAKLTLHLISWFGDSSASFGFTVHKITTGWSQQGLVWDSVQAGFYESGIVRGSYSGTVEADTQIISVDLDTSMVREWMQPTTISSYGILLAPTPSTNVIRGINASSFDSTSYWPTLEVIAENIAGTVRDTTTFIYGIDTFVGNLDNLVTNPALLYLQSGVVYRSKLTFDVSTIPRGTLISSADLMLVRDPASSSASKFIAAPLALANVLLSESSLLSFESGSSSAEQVGTTDTFKIDLRHAVQLWLRGNNYGVLLRAPSWSEFNSNASIAFYNQNATTEALRPKLKVKCIIP